MIASSKKGLLNYLARSLGGSAKKNKSMKEQKEFFVCFLFLIILELLLQPQTDQTVSRPFPLKSYAF